MKNISCTTRINTSDVEILEISEARQIYRTYETLKDRVLVNKQVQYASKWFGQDGSRRILGYVKKFESGEIE